MSRKWTSHRTSLLRNTSYRQFNLPQMSKNGAQFIVHGGVSKL